MFCLPILKDVKNVILFFIFVVFTFLTFFYFSSVLIIKMVEEM